MKHFVILFLMFCGLFVCLYYILTRTDKSENMQQHPKTPIAYIDKSVIESINMIEKWQLDLSKEPQTAFKKNERIKLRKPEQKVNKSSLFDYVTIGKCQENQFSPDYLDHKLSGSNKNGSKNTFGGLRIPSCGFIRTKIPFSF